jgi:hypothetical protein
VPLLPTCSTPVSRTRTATGLLAPASGPEAVPAA